MSVIRNTLKSESTLKKYNTNTYHAVCKSVAMRESLTGHVRSGYNPADLLTHMMRIPNNQQEQYPI